MLYRLSSKVGLGCVACLPPVFNRHRPSSGNPFLFLFTSCHQSKRRLPTLCQPVCLSRFSGGQRCRSLLKCVVGSHQASFLPSEEESFQTRTMSGFRFDR